MGIHSARRPTSLHPKCHAVVRTCKGNFVYFVKCPEGSKVTQEYCRTVATDDTVLFKCAHQKDTGNLNLISMVNPQDSGYSEISNFLKTSLETKCQRLFIFAFSESFKRSQVI